MKHQYRKQTFSYQYIFAGLLIISQLFTSFFASAQTARRFLYGKVTDQKGQPLFRINVQLEERTVLTSTDEKGEFTLALSSENSTVLLTGIGFKSVRENIKSGNLPENRIIYTLIQTDQALQQVEIIGQKKSSYKSDYTFGATKTATYLKDIPQSVSIVTKELIADRQIERAWDVTKLMSGVNRYSNYNDIVIRGFRSGENQPRLINGLRAAFGYFDQPITANLERIEVIKGPASALFGNAVPGGTINFVTKKPLPEKRYGFSFSSGSFNTIRASGDFTGPLLDSTILYRVNAAYSNAGSFRDLQFNENYMIAPSFSFIPSKKTSLNVDLVYNASNSRIDRGQPIFGATSNTAIYATPISLALGAPNDFYKVKNLQLSANLTHQFTDYLSLNASYMKFIWDEALLEHRTSNTYAVDGSNKEISNLVAMQVFDRLQKLYSDNINLFLNWKLQKTAVKQTILVGYDNISQTRPVGSTQNVARGYRNAANNGIIATYNPANKSAYLLDKNGNPVPNVAFFDIQNVQYPIRNTSNYIFAATIYNPSKYFINAGYLQDQLTYKNLQVLIGLRQEFYTDKTNYKQSTETKVTQHAFIPRVGLIYAINPQINLYGTYTEGYQPQSPSTFNNPNNGGPFNPSKSNMVESGAKASFFSNQLAVNFSVYHILQKNVLVSANDPVNADLLRQRGKEQSNGFELEAVGNILPGLSINANYAYNNAIVKEGLPAEVGLQKANAPKHSANFWTKYSIVQGTFAGLGFGGGINYSAKRNTEIFTLQLPAYTTADVAGYYTFNKVRLSINLNNVFNQRYWIAGYNYTRLFPGEPRNVMLNISKLF
ncbi:MAG: TonB-dependent siderophore receptor [Sphingobacteriaceae bacterium]|nr:MAG: TonB-dependent siderophore receptor [Sphingobacteriaceae bacterium]